MKIYTYLAVLLLVLTGLSTVSAQEYTRGNVITSEENVVSGKPYLLYYVSKNGTSAESYVKASSSFSTYFQVKPQDRTITEEAFFYFISNGDSPPTWKIKSRNTGMYFPTPNSKNWDNFNPVVEANAGAWTLNEFTANGNFAPTCTNGETQYWLNRSNERLHAWLMKDGGASELRIYEIALSATPNSDFANKEINISGTAATTLAIGQWYVMKPTGTSNYFIDDNANDYTTSTAPVLSAPASAKYLVQLTAAGDGKYYVETGFGNYLFTNGSSYITTRVSAQQYSATDLTTDFDLYPVTLQDPFSPIGSKYYQIKTDDNAGASDNWIFSPTGYGSNQYYLFNTSSHQFAYPTESGLWSLEPSAVPVILERQIDGHYIIKTKDGTTPFRIGSETLMNITEIGDTTSLSPQANLNTALQGLIGAYTQITETSQITDGWYALRIKSDSSNPLYDGNFLYTLPTPYGEGTIEYPYPVGHGGPYNQHPSKDNTNYYFRIWPIERSDGNTYYHWQLSNGIYIVNYKNNYPIMYHQDLSDFIIGQNDDGTFYIQSSNFRAQAADGYVGKTARKFMESTTKLEILRKDLTDAGLTAWKLINEGADDVPVTCTNTHINGSKVAYNGGFYMLPTGFTPASNEFTMEGMYGAPVVDDVAKTITVVYAPTICFTAENVTVVQGNRTTGKGNKRQILLRIKVVPQAPCYPESFSVTLTNGASEIEKVEAYMTSSEQLDAEGSRPVKLGEQGTISNDLTISVTDPTSADNLIHKGQDAYLWITADIKSGALENNSIDAKVTAIGYQNQASSNSCDVTSIGDPDGEMRIFLRQQYVRVSTETAGIESYYRNPAILRDDDNLLAFCDYRYDNVLGLGKDYDNTDFGHRIDVLMFKSTDNGASWTTTPVTVAAGSDGDAEHEPSGFAGPAVARTNSGKLICLMAMGRRSYESNGLGEIGYTYSSDYGATWSTPVDIWSSINWNGVAHSSSAYVTPGKGVTFSNGRVAFVLNVKSGNYTNEYLLYSDDDGATWSVAPTPLTGKGKESKLEEKNDHTMLITGAKPISIACNTDILYFGRSPEAAGIRDAIVHTIIWYYNGEPKRMKELRLYTNFEQGDPDKWKEMFTITPANAATSSMQKTADGHLAIFFEDGSIGNNEKDSCYALNCVVISKEMIEAKQTDLYTAKVIGIGEKRTSDFVDWEDGTTGNWYKRVKTKSDTGIKDVVVSSTHYAFNREGGDDQRVLVIKPSAANTVNDITITAPDGYIIKSYSLTGFSKSTDANTYTLTAADGTSKTLSGGVSNKQTFSVDNIYYKTAVFTISSTDGNYADFTEFKVELAKEYSVVLHQVNTGGSGDQKSYATLFVPFDLIQTDNKTKAYYVIEAVAGGKARLMPLNNDGRDIPYRTAVVLINSDGAEHVSFAVTSGLPQKVSEATNKLKGTLEAMTLDQTKNDSNPNYSLGRRRVRKDEVWGDYVAGFYQNGKADSQLGANRAYLLADVAPAVTDNSRGFDFTFDSEGGEPTDISLIDNREFENEYSVAAGWYTLDGRQLSKAPSAKGIYIRNGRKIVIK